MYSDLVGGMGIPSLRTITLALIVPTGLVMAGKS